MINTAIHTWYKNLSTRQLQAYAALCLKNYCESLNISHLEIDKLVAHLFGILVSDDLPAWEHVGACLVIAGRGDPVPEEVERIVPMQNLEDFRKLVEYCIEVGIVDMYGASTALPLEFLEKCLAILDKSETKLPSINELTQLGKTGDVWAEPLNTSEYQHLAEHYQIGLQ